MNKIQLLLQQFSHHSNKYLSLKQVYRSNNHENEILNKGGNFLYFSPIIY